MNILIVDDNALMRMMLRTLVEPMAEAIYECSDGCTAAASYELYRPTLTLGEERELSILGLKTVWFNVYSTNQVKY